MFTIFHTDEYFIKNTIQIITKDKSTTILGNKEREIFYNFIWKPRQHQLGPSPQKKFRKLGFAVQNILSKAASPLGRVASRKAETDDESHNLILAHSAKGQIMCLMRV